MIKKHFTASEQEALRTFNKLNSLVKEGIITICKRFDSFEEMITTHISINTDSSLSGAKQRHVLFIRKKSRDNNFAVNVIMKTLGRVFTQKHKDFKPQKWYIKKIIIGKVDYVGLGSRWTGWRVHETEEIEVSILPKLAFSRGKRSNTSMHLASEFLYKS